MPMPPGTYLKVKAGDKTKAMGADAKKAVASSQVSEKVQFFETLDRVSESRLASWHKDMTVLAAAIKKSEPLSPEDKVRKAVADVLGEVKKLLLTVKD